MAVYSSQLLKITWNNILITGYATGTFIKVTRRTDSVSLVVGADGGTTFVFSADRSGEVELTLRREHRVNTLLSAAVNAMDRGDFARGIGSFLVENVRSGAQHSAPNAVISKPPDMEGATDATPIMWKFLLDDLRAFDGAVEV